MKIGIIGFGVVGQAIDYSLSKKYQIIKYDKYVEHNSFGELYDCSFVFVSVPTPFDCEKNKVDDSAIIESLDRLAEIGYKNIVIIKSTVPPGTCVRYMKKYNLRIVFNPEFLRESNTPNEDFEKQDTIVIGTDNSKSYDSVKSLFEAITVPHAQYYQTSTTMAEMIKCAQNTMLASRVALANMIYDACNNEGIEYEKVREIAFDNFDVLGPHMVQVPGPDGKRGFGGKCLPKDIRAFSTTYDSDLLRTIINYNDSLRDDIGQFLLNFRKEIK